MQIPKHLGIVEDVNMNTTVPGAEILHLSTCVVKMQAGSTGVKQLSLKQVILHVHISLISLSFVVLTESRYEMIILPNIGVR